MHKTASSDPKHVAHTHPKGSDAETQESRKAETELVNHPEVCQHPATNEMPNHLAAKTHAPLPEKPPVQHINEQLTDATPTGYAPHDPNVDIDHPLEVKKAAEHPYAGKEHGKRK